MNGYILIFFTC